MPLDQEFYQKTDKLKVTGMGTEHVAPLLYSLIRMLRPRRVLEVGLGYTSPFIAQALQDNVEEYLYDKQVLEGKIDDVHRNGVLNDGYYNIPYIPKLYAIDDYSIEGTSAPKVLEVIKSLNLDHVVDLTEGDFRGQSKSMNPMAFPLDFVWFDCGGHHEYIDFIEEYWPLINSNFGMLLFHFTYWEIRGVKDGKDQKKIILGSIANEIKRQQLAAGVQSGFEVLSLLEPHKRRQGSITQIRKLPENSRCRNVSFEKEIESLSSEPCKPIISL